jgi:hypothetical protein
MFNYIGNKLWPESDPILQNLSNSTLFINADLEANFKTWTSNSKETPLRSTARKVINTINQCLASHSMLQGGK